MHCQMHYALWYYDNTKHKSEQCTSHEECTVKDVFRDRSRERKNVISLRWVNYRENYTFRGLKGQSLNTGDVKDSLDCITSTFRKLHCIKNTPHPSKIQVTKSHWAAITLTLSSISLQYFKYAPTGDRRLTACCKWTLMLGRWGWSSGNSRNVWAIHTWTLSVFTQVYKCKRRM